jgi:carotenoid cleavage dioxygenase
MRRPSAKRIAANDVLLKHDMVGGNTQARTFGCARKRSASSSFTRPSPTAAEDDGVLMGFVYDRAHRPQ